MVGGFGGVADDDWSLFDGDDADSSFLAAMDSVALAPDEIHVDADAVAVDFVAVAVSPADNILDALGVDKWIAVAVNDGSKNAAAQIRDDFDGALTVEVDSGPLGFD